MIEVSIRGFPMFNQRNINRDSLNHESGKKVDYMLDTGMGYGKLSHFISKCDIPIKLVTRAGVEFLCKKSFPAKIDDKLYNGLFFSVLYTFPKDWIERLKHDTSSLNEILYDIISSENKIHKDPDDFSITPFNFQKKGFIPTEELSTINNGEIVYIPHLDVIACSPKRKILPNEFPAINIENPDMIPELHSIQNHAERIIYTHNVNKELFYSILGKNLLIPDNVGNVQNLTIKNNINGRSYTDVYDINNIPKQFEITEDILPDKLSLKEAELRDSYKRKIEDLIRSIQEVNKSIEYEKNTTGVIADLNAKLHLINNDLLSTTNTTKLDSVKYKVLMEKMNKRDTLVDTTVEAGLMLMRMLVI